MDKPKKIIGILGGMGPLATVNFFADVISICQKKYNAEQDTDYPKIYLYDTALEGFNETGFEKPELVKEQLINDTKKLENWGADFIVIPCNTVHYFIEDMEKNLKIPIISIVDSTIEQIKKNNYNKIGVLSSASSRELGLYEKKLNSEAFKAIVTTVEEQRFLNSVVLSVMSGNQGENERKGMQKVINRMKDSGADAIVLGCTELSLAISDKDSSLPLFNTIHILAEAAVDYSYQI